MITVENISDKGDMNNWTLSLSLEKIQDLETIQRNSVRIIDKNFTSYENYMKKLNIITLLEKRNILSFKFANKNVFFIKKLKTMFHLITHTTKEWTPETKKVLHMQIMKDSEIQQFLICNDY